VASSNSRILLLSRASRPMIDTVTTQSQIAIAILVALAVFVVFICPLTFGPPAPQQKKSLLASLLAFSFTLFAVLLTRAASDASLRTSSSNEQQPSWDRLALICTRLC
jgi:hypothetical protein